MVKKICEKKVSGVTYKLRFFDSDNKYVVYKIDDKVMEDGKIHRIPREAVFSSEKDAKEYIEKLN